MLVPHFRRSAPAALTIVVALAAAGSAQAAKAPPGQEKKEPLSGVTYTLEDAEGRVVETKSGLPEHVSIQPMETAGGCASVDAWRRSTTLFGATAYVFH